LSHGRGHRFDPDQVRQQLSFSERRKLSLIGRPSLCWTVNRLFDAVDSTIYFAAFRAIGNLAFAQACVSLDFQSQWGGKIREVLAESPGILGCKCFQVRKLAQKIHYAAGAKLV
jgi:hypothetical protein